MGINPYPPGIKPFRIEHPTRRRWFQRPTVTLIAMLVAWTVFLFGWAFKPHAESVRLVAGSVMYCLGMNAVTEWRRRERELEIEKTFNAIGGIGRTR